MHCPQHKRHRADSSQDSGNRGAPSANGDKRPQEVHEKCHKKANGHHSLSFLFAERYICQTPEHNKQRMVQTMKHEHHNRTPATHRGNKGERDVSCRGGASHSSQPLLDSWTHKLLIDRKQRDDRYRNKQPQHNPHRGIPLSLRPEHWPPQSKKEHRGAPIYAPSYGDPQRRPLFRPAHTFPSLPRRAPNESLIPPATTSSLGHEVALSDKAKQNSVPCPDFRVPVFHPS